MEKLNRNFKIRVWLILISMGTAIWCWAIESYIIGLGSVAVFIASCIWWVIDDNKSEKISKNIKGRLRYRVQHDEFEDVVFSTKKKYHGEDVHDLQDEFIKKIDFDATAMDNFVSGQIDDISFEYYEEFVLFINSNKSHYFSVLSFPKVKEVQNQIIKNDSRLNSFNDLTYIVIKDNTIRFYIENNMHILKAIMEDEIELYIGKLKGLIRQLSLVVDEL